MFRKSFYIFKTEKKKVTHKYWNAGKITNM